MPAPVAFILKGYPRLSETFIAQEIHALERLGLDLRIVSLRHPTDRARHPVHDDIRAPVNYLPEYLYQEPLRVLRAWWAVRRGPSYNAVRRRWLADLKRDMTPNRVRRFGQALVLARELAADVGHLHAHFMHTPGSVARYTAQLLGLPYSISAHAKDIWTIPEWEKREKLADCAWLTTCNKHGYGHLRELAGDMADKVSLNYHGVDLRRFAKPGPNTLSGPLSLLTVGRAVGKKGLNHLLDALAALPAALDWRWHHIGGGPRLDDLKRQASRLGLDDRVTWHGAQPQEKVLAAYRSADLFILPSVRDPSGDQDGLPNVLMEAQSQGLACISSDLAGIPDLIVDGSTGLLVPPGDVAALTNAIQRLIDDADLRQRLGRAGQDRVWADFDAARLIPALAAKFDLAPLAEDSAA